MNSNRHRMPEHRQPIHAPEQGKPEQGRTAQGARLAAGLRGRLLGCAMALPLLTGLLVAVSLTGTGSANATAARDSAVALTDRQILTSPVGSYLAGRFAQHADDWAAAATYMEHALSATPGDIALLQRTFLLKLGEGQIGAALDYARRLTGNDNDSHMAVALLATDALSRGALDDAARFARMFPKDGLARFMSPLAGSWIALARRDVSAAETALAPLAGANGFKALHDLHMALILDMAGRTEPAAGYYHKLVGSQSPLRVIQLVGNFFERTGRSEEANRLYQTFKTDNPDSSMIDQVILGYQQRRTGGQKAQPLIGDAGQGLAEAMFDLGSALHQEGAQETALLFGQLALHLRPGLPLAQLMVGDILASRDHHGQALGYYQALKNDPVLGQTARLREATALGKLDRKDEAITAFRQIAAENPDESSPMVWLGDLYRGLERYEEAVDAYGEALRRNQPLKQPDWPVLYARAMSLDKLKRGTESEADLKEALRLQPNEPYLLNYLGYTWIDRGVNLEKARDMVLQAVALRPRDGYIMDSVGWALYRLGDFEGAVNRLEQAVELQPVDPTINDHLGDAYWRVGRRHEARFQWNRAMRNAENDEQRDAIATKLEKGLIDPKAAEAVGTKQ